MVKRTNVLEVLCDEYAKLIADAAIGGRAGLAPHERAGKRYWWFATRTFHKLVSGELSPSSLVRENKLLVASAECCGYCGDPGVLHWEHLFPRSRGGPDTIDNLILACRPCNLHKGALNPIDWYWKRGMHRRFVPRLVMGKCLKLVRDEHAKRGTLLDTEFPEGHGLVTAQVFRVFEVSTAAVKKKSSMSCLLYTSDAADE